MLAKVVCKRPTKTFTMMKLFALLIICIIAKQLNAQASQHLTVQRLNDSYIDVYIHNKHPEKKMPLLILCQGSGYDSKTKGFLGAQSSAGLQIPNEQLNSWSMETIFFK